MFQQSTNPLEWLAAGELERRQHILVKGGGTTTVFTVEHSLPYRSGPDQMVALTLAPVGGGEPQAVKWSAGYEVRLASEDEVAEAVDAARRATVVKGLRDLAGLIAERRIQIRPYGGPGVSVHLADGEVSRLAEALDLELSDYGQTTRSVAWRPEGSDEYGDGVSVTFYGKPAPGPLPVPEHYHAAGAGGEAGACSAVCACGVTFAGFDSIAEAVAELDKHIANPEPEQEWLFTFGSGQQHDGRFVRITGTYQSARARMLEVFGTAWCDQYDWRRFDELGLPAVLTELPDSEWTDGEIVAGIVAALDGPTADVPAQRSGE